MTTITDAMMALRERMDELHQKAYDERGTTALAETENERTQTWQQLNTLEWKVPTLYSLRMEFTSEEARRQFAEWLSESGEQSFHEVRKSSFLYADPKHNHRFIGGNTIKVIEWDEGDDGED